jgi:hypothetical protein
MKTPFSSVSTSLIYFPKEHEDIQYFKEICDYLKESDIEFRYDLKNINNIFSFFSVDKQKHLIKNSNIDMNKLILMFTVKNKKCV